ncbi:MAG: hypothetical protein GPJ13_03630 [Microcystis aeruginosa W11-06]|nr:hypothetical protein [Microcystis aeruginosa W11-03]NCR92891.1 hypothetical protein [Microcystis aeruginosa W11-06]
MDFRCQSSGDRRQETGDSPDEKIFTTKDERGFLPYTPHPTPHTGASHLCNP